MTELGIDLGRFLGTSLRSRIALAAENLFLVTSHPTAAWTLQQFREVLAMPHPYRFVLHDRDKIYSPWFDAAVTAMGVRVLRTPVQAPKA
ncbi:MAG TPA: hypothetical protein VF464_10430, partial [Candidatus Methylomirabilis sp.]